MLAKSGCLTIDDKKDTAMITGKDQNEVVLVLSQEEYDYMYKLLLDYGAYAPPENMRTKLARKIAMPALVRDDRVPTLTSWLWSLLPIPRFRFSSTPSEKNTRSSFNPA